MAAVQIALISAWIALPVLGGPAVADALAQVDSMAATRWSAALWVLWAVATGALFVPTTTTLTASRLLVPAGGALSLWAAAVGDPSAVDVAAATFGAIATLLVLTPTVGSLFVDGSSYGDERRFCLRAPALLLVGPIPLLALAAVAGATAGPALILAESFEVGAVACVCGGAIAVPCTAALHRLSRRWLVFVPAGVVLHDHLVLSEPVLFHKSQIASIGPAEIDTDSYDLTAGAAGLALEIKIDSSMRIGLAVRRGEEPTEVDVDSVMFTPTLPGAVVDEARRRRLGGSSA